MNHHLLPTTAEPADTVLAQNRAKDSAAFRSLALQLRRNGHDYRRWSIEHAAAGHAEAAAIFAARANRYAADALLVLAPQPTGVRPIRRSIMTLYPPTSPDWDELCSLDDAFLSRPQIDAPDDGRYELQAPCPCCFESSGYMARSVPDTWSEPGWAEPDPTRPCDYCAGTGSVEAQPIDVADLAIMCGDVP